jgi:hypothetical protein
MSYPDTPADDEDDTPIDWREVTDGGFIFLPRREGDDDEPQIDPEPRIDRPSLLEAAAACVVVAGFLFLSAAVLGGLFRVFRLTAGF